MNSSSARSERMRCANCGSRQFAVLADKRENVKFTYDESGRAVVYERELESAIPYEIIRCEMCGTIVGHRSEWVAEGIEVPQ